MIRNYPNRGDQIARRSCALATFVAILVLILPCTYCNGALVLPNATFKEGGLDIFAPETYSFDYTQESQDPYRYYSIQISSVATGGYDPAIDIQGNLDDNYGPNLTQMQGTIRYYVGVSGPTTVLVPLRLHVVGHVSVNGTGAGASGYVRLGAGNFVDAPFVQIEASSGGAPFDDFDLVHTYSILSNTDYNWFELHVWGEVSHTAAAYGNGGYQAIVDPIIEIDPEFANASLYTLELSSNIPEPALFWLSLLPVVCAARARRNRVLQNWTR